MSPLDFLTRGLGDGYRSLGARHPGMLTVALGLGMLIKLIVMVLARETTWVWVAAFNEVYWYQYAIIVLAALLLPSIFGKSRAPDSVLDSIAGLKKIMEEGNISEEHRRRAWLQFLSKFINDTNIGPSLPQPPQNLSRQKEPGEQQRQDE